MGKSMLYRLLGIGSIPKKLRPVLETEGIVVSDEGMGGWYITGNVKGPGKRFIHRREGFSGCLVVTEKRVIGYTNWKRQINIAVDDPKLSSLYVELLDPQRFSISFESSVFREDWQGVVEFRFRSEKAQEFHDVLTALGVQEGAAAGSTSRRT